MRLRAYFDDSGSNTGTRDLVFAGLLHRADAWPSFKNNWKRALQASPAVSYLKMVEANGLRGQFAGWSREQRDTKLDVLAKVIEQFDPMTVDISVSGADYDRLIRPTSPRGLATPYFVCTFGAVAMTARYVASEGLSVPIDFVFDQQTGVDQDIALFLDYMLENLEPSAAALVQRPVLHADHKTEVALQAADMLAWHIRRSREALASRSLLERTKLIRCSHALESRIESALLDTWAVAFAQLEPTLSRLRTKSAWQEMRRSVAAVLATGFKPPHGDEDVFTVAARIREALKDTGHD